MVEIKSPLLSICIPTYNRSNLLDKQLSRIVPQIIKADNYIELFISDNCSTDSTEIISTNYSNNYNFVRYKKNSLNIGLVQNVLNCFLFSKGEYVWVLGDDDDIDSYAVSIIVDLILNNQGISLIHLNSKIINGLNLMIEEDSYYSYSLQNQSNLLLKDLVLDKKRIDAFMAISCNISKRSVALDSINSWKGERDFLAFPLYIYLYCALESLVLCINPLVSQTYYTNSWKNSASLVYNIQIPNILLQLKHKGIDQTILDSYFKRFIFLKNFKGYIFFLVKNPLNTYSFFRNLFLYLTYKNG